VNKNLPTPLYYQLADRLREQIASGQLKPGEQLPSERELSQTSGISRMTVRQALGYLEREGLLVVKSGIGTFVAEPKLTYDAINLIGFTETMLGRKGKLSSKVLSQKICPASVHVSRVLALLGQREVIEIVRVRLIDDVPMAIETNYLPAQRFAGLETMNLNESSLYSILEDIYGVKFQQAEQTIEASSANPFEQEQLGVAEGVSMLLIEGTSFEQNNQPIEFFKSSFRGDRFKVSVMSQRQAQQFAQASFSLILD
jgi:GntR family transcriptional regulator